MLGEAMPKYLSKKVVTILILFTVLILSGCLVLPQEVVLHDQARYLELMQFSEKQVPSIRSAPTSSLYFLCTAYGKLKQYDKLFPCVDALENNIDRGDYIAFLEDRSPEPYLLRAEAYLDLGRYKDAVEQAHKAMAKAKRRNFVRREISALSILGLAYALEGDRSSALTIVKRMETEYQPSWIDKSRFAGIAKILIAIGRYSDALAVMQRKESSQTQFVIGTTNFFAGGNFFVFMQLPQDFMYAKCLFETGNLSGAKKQYDELLANATIESAGGLYWQILFDRGRISEKEQNPKEAIGFYKRAIEIIEQQRSTITTEASKIGFVGDKQAVYHNLVRVLFSAGQYEKAFEYVERAKSRALVDLLAGKKDFTVKEGNEQEIGIVLARKEAAEAEALLQETSIDRQKSRGIRIRVADELEKKAPELASLVSVTSQSISELQAIIPSEEIIIEYYYRDKDMYAFAISKTELRAVKLNSEGLTDDIQAFRKLLETPDSKGHDEIGKKLYMRILGPLATFIGKHNLIIVPHGSLHYLPINALHDGTGYMVEKYGIRIIPSASVIRYLQNKSVDKKGGILVFGNPDLGNPGYDLIYAQSEAQEVANTRAESKVFLRKDATESMLRKYGGSYNYIHFATHGIFDPAAPLKSALFLAPDTQYDGRLTVDKLYSMKLNTNLITLSACETGLSLIANGDELVGLARGFLYAGASSIVSSLWKVDDLATSYLMTRFYKNLDRADKGEALQTAQLETKKVYPHPYYWASFQLTGNSK